MAQAIFHNISRLEYIHSHLSKSGSAAAMAYAALTVVADNVDLAVAVELIPSIEAILPARLSHSNSHRR